MGIKQAKFFSIQYFQNRIFFVGPINECNNGVGVSESIHEWLVHKNTNHLHYENWSTMSRSFCGGNEIIVTQTCTYTRYEKGRPGQRKIMPKKT